MSFLSAINFLSQVLTKGWYTRGSVLSFALLLIAIVDSAKSISPIRRFKSSPALRPKQCNSRNIRLFLFCTFSEKGFNLLPGARMLNKESNCSLFKLFSISILYLSLFLGFFRFMLLMKSKIYLRVSFCPVWERCILHSHSR